MNARGRNAAVNVWTVLRAFALTFAWGLVALGLYVWVVGR